MFPGNAGGRKDRHEPPAGFKKTTADAPGNWWNLWWFV